MVVGRRKSEFGDLDEVSVVQVKEGDDGDRVVLTGTLQGAGGA